MVRNADNIENVIGPEWADGQYARGFGGTVEPERSPRAQRIVCGCCGSDGFQIATYYYDAGNRRVRKTVMNGGLSGNIPNGTTDYPGAAAHTGMGRSGFRVAEDSGFPGPRPSPLNIWQGWQVAEERNPFGGSGSTDTPIRQYVWGGYIDECI